MKLMNSIATPSWIAGFKVSIYKCRNCNRSMALGQATARKAGIRIREHWYCSSRCFTSAAEREFLDLVKPGRTQGSNGSRATRWGCPVFSVPKHSVQAGIDIPSTLLQLCSAIPLHYVAATKVLLIGFVQDIEYGLLYAIEQITGCKTQPCFVTPTDFQSQMQEREQSSNRARAEASKEVRIEDVQTPAEMARTLCSFVVDFEADEARMVKCKDYVWSRLKAGPKEVDLLFKAI